MRKRLTTRGKRKWRDALAAKLSASATTLAAAEGALGLANTVTAELADADAPRNRIAAIRAKLNALEAGARRLAEALAPEWLASGDWPDVARRLTMRLAAAREIARAIDRADEAVRQADGKVADAAAAVAGADARIQPLLQRAGVASIDAALPLAERSDRQRQLRQAVDARTRRWCATATGCPGPPSRPRWRNRTLPTCRRIWKR
ncbi:Uncharacterized conserved protein [Burkholderia cenocepacia]|nr:Uncharacterized conserved protein [Burkholderia cenocepacia]